MRPISTTWRRARRLTAALGALGLALASLPGALSAQGAGGTISGRVVDGANGAPVGGASVVVSGTSVGTQTGEDGRYSLLVPTTGLVTLRITRIGYEARSLPVTVRAGETVTANTSLTAASYSLSSVVVTATGQQRKIELANATTTISVADKIAELPASNMGQLLSGRSSGVQVLDSPESGAGARIRIRGQSSLSLNNNPVIIIDGVRVNGSQSDGPSVGGPTPSRMNDINPEEIESIEVIKGPSAATLYGTEAAAGVINITTKRGRAGQTTWSVYTENGITNDSREGDYPLLYRLYGKRNGGASSTRCVLTEVAAGSCVIDSLASGNVLNDPELTPLSTGFRQQYGIQTSGGSERVQFFASAEREMETGIYEMPELERQRLEAERGPVPDEQLRPSGLNRTNLRVNLTAQLAEKLSLQISTGFVQSDNLRPQNNNNGNGIMVAAMGGTWTPEAVDSRGIPLRGYRSFPMGDVLSRTTTQDVNRFINSAALRWEPFDWLSTRATVGYDFTNVYNKEITRFDQGPLGNNRVGQIDEERNNTTQGTVDIGATITRRLNSWLGSKTSIGTQYISNRSVQTGGNGLALPPSATQITAAATRTIFAGLAETRTLGTYVEQQFSVNDKLFLTGALRRDAASAFGSEARGVLYPKVGASWAISEESFMPVTDWLSSLRLRTSYGASGQIPGTTAALRFYDAFPATISAGGAEAPSVSIGALGNSNLKPEYSAEFEGGFDASLFNGRTNLEFTYYNKETTDALISRRIAPSLAGVTSRFENIGNTTNSGIELSLSHVIVDRENFTFDIAINGSTNQNELVTLGEGVSPIPSGNRNTQLNTPGFPLFGMWGRPFTFNDADGNGILEQSEMAYGDTAEFIGPTYPTREFAITPTLELFGRKLRIQSQIDRKWGHRKLNNTLRHMCQGGSSCRGLYDPDAPLDVQAAALGAQRGIFTGMYEDGSFTRLRELSISYQLPNSWAQAVRASRWNVILTGRNLAVWTPFSGLDPETTSFNNDGNGNEEFFSTPPLQMWTFRMNFSF